MSIPTQAQNVASLMRVMPFACFAALLFTYTLIFDDFFPLPGGRLGHDYALGLPGLLDGLIWFKNNGLSAPWFSPSFCGGQPYFADPQSGYYSLMQLLALLVNPLLASFLTLLIAASGAFWGAYLLLRRVFAADRSSAILAGGLLMFNAFIPHRMMIGHLGYHGLALIPWLALVLLIPARSRIDAAVLGLAGGGLLAYLLHNGMGTLMIPLGIAVFALALLHVQRIGDLQPFLTRSLGAIPVALLLSASKLSAGMSTLSNFPRDFYPLPGIQSLPDTLLVIGAALFLPSEWVQRFATPRLANLQWALDPHEWAFGFTAATALLLALLLVHHRKALRLPGDRSGWLRLLLLTGCLAIPIAFCTYTPEWNAFLKRLPILRSTSTPTRWLIVFIPFIAIAMGLMLARAHWRPNVKAGLALATLGGVITLTALEPRGFYQAQHYDLRPVVLADRAIRSGEFKPEIHGLGTRAEISVGQHRMALGGNDTFLGGISQMYCYNPLFGYRLEKFVPGNIRPGPVLEARNGLLNVKNPVCYVFPKENNCAPGDVFREDQIDAARNFVNYRPFAFNKSPAQGIADLLNAVALVLMVVLLLAYAGWRILGRRRQASLDNPGGRPPTP